MSKNNSTALTEVDLILTTHQQRTPDFFALLSLPATAMGFALSVQISALSWILTTHYGLSIRDVGLVWAAGPIAGIIGQVATGIICDNNGCWRGRRKPYIFISGMCAALMLLALPSINIISDRFGVDGIVAIAIAIALGLNLSINFSVNPSRGLLIGISSDDDNRSKGSSWMQSIFSIFGVMAYAISAWVGNYVLIYVSVALVVCFSIIPCLLLEEPNRASNNTSNIVEEQRGIGFIILAIRPLWAFSLYGIYSLAMRAAGISFESYYAESFCLIASAVLMLITLFNHNKDPITAFHQLCSAHALSWIGVQTMFIFIIVFIQQKMPTLNSNEIGQVLAICFLILNAVAAIAPAAILQPLSKRFGHVPVHTACVGSMTVVCFAISLWGDNRTLLYFFMAVLGIGWSSILNLPFAILSQRTPSNQKGLYRRLFNLSVVIPQLFVSLGVGLAISNSDGKEVIFQICTLALFLSMVSWANADSQN